MLSCHCAHEKTREGFWCAEILAGIVEKLSIMIVIIKSSKDIYRKSTFVQLVIYIFLFVYILFFSVLNENVAVLTYNVLLRGDV